MKYTICFQPDNISFGAVRRNDFAGNDCCRSASGYSLRSLLVDACREAKILPSEVTLACIVYNTAMHHILLGINVKSLVTPPYMPNVKESMEISADELLPIHRTQYRRDRGSR